MVAPRWYDRFASFYDSATLGDVFYREPRKAAIEQLELAAGASVVDLFCGTGVDLSQLAKKIGQGGSVLAVDGSAAMLERAGVRAKEINVSVEFMQADFSQSDGIESVETAITEKQPQHIFLPLGLTCLANWRDFFARIFDASPSGTRFVIMDVHADRVTVGSRFINWVGAADCRRPVWRVLEERCDSFTWREFRPFKVLDVSVFVASGIKPLCCASANY